MTVKAAPEICPWVSRFAPLVPAAGTVLDLACGNGRHTQYFLKKGHPVTALDKDTTGLSAFIDHPNCKIVPFDLEAPDLIDRESGTMTFDAQLPFYAQQFDCIVVVNYLYRPLLPLLSRALSPGGILIYQTFMAGNEVYGRPRNPDFLLAPGELSGTLNESLEQIDRSEGYTEHPKPAVIQRYCGRKY